jgi:hypothetical protein
VRRLDRLNDDVLELGSRIEQIRPGEEPRNAERRRRNAPYCVERRSVRTGDGGQWAGSSQSRIRRTISVRSVLLVVGRRQRDEWWSVSKMAVWITVVAGVLVAAGVVLKRTVFSDDIDAGQVSQGWLRELRAEKQEGLRS